MKFLNHNLFTGDITVYGTTTLSTATGITRATGDNSTHLATTAFVKAQGYSTISGTTNYVSKFTGASTLGNSIIYDNGTNVGIGTTSPDAKLQVVGNLRVGAGGANDKIELLHGAGAGDYGAIRFHQGGTEYQRIHSFSSAWQGGTIYSASSGAINISGGYGVTLGFWYDPAAVINTAGPSYFKNNVLIGTTTDAGFKLDVNGTGRFSGVITAGNRVASNNSFSDADAVRVLKPLGGFRNSFNTTETGAIKITYPVGYTHTMHRVKVNIYNYAGNQAYTVYFGGYNYAPGPAWVNTFAYTITPSETNFNPTVRFGYDGEYMVVYIGELNTSWSYPQIFIEEVETGFALNSKFATDSWEIGLETSAFQNVTSTRSNTQSTNWARNDNSVYFGIGNVGIGTTSPDRKLTVTTGTPSGATTAASNTAVLIDSAANQYLEFRTASASSGYMQGLLFTDNGRNAFIGFKEYTGAVAGTYGESVHFSISDFSGSDAGSGFYFGTSSNNENGVTSPLVFLRSNGNMMIGTTTDAGYKLDVNGTLRVSGAATFSSSVTTNSNFSAVGASSSTAPQLNFNQIGGNTYSAIGINRADGTGVAAGLGSAFVLRSGDATNLPIQFATANNVRLTIASDGNVGIGTTSPGYKLDVQGSAGNVTINTNGALFAGGQFISGTGEFASSSSGTDLNFRAGATHLMVLKTSGNVGIGTTNPSSKLEVIIGEGSAGFNKGINIVSGNGTFTTGHGGILQFKNEDVITAGIRGVRDPGSWASSMLFYTHNSSVGNTFGTTFVERMRITDGGNVGIGTTGPSTKLHVAGLTTLNSTERFTANGNGFYFGNQSSAYRNPDTNIPAVVIRMDESNAGLDETKAALVLYNANGGLNTGAGLTFASREAVGAGNDVALSGVFGIKETAGTANAWSSGGLRFWTKNQGNIIEAVSIINNGNVGIGTTTPYSPLQIVGGGGNGTLSITGTSITSHFNYGSNEDTYLRGGKAAATIYIADANTGNVLIANGGGNVGIGNNNPSYKLDVSGNARITSTLDVTGNIVTAGNISASGYIGSNTSQTRDKLRVWGTNEYNIGMKSGYDYGHLGNDEYAMSFQMNDNSGRGFWWGDTAHSDDQGAASLTTDGRMTIAKSLSVGEGEAVILPSSTPLYVKGSTSGADVIGVDGVNGRLFTVTDDLSDSLFSVNTIAGLPVIEAFADNTVNIGKYGYATTWSTTGFVTMPNSANIYRDLFINGGRSGNFGNRLIIGTDASTYTLQDGNQRPTAYLHGAYPVLTLNHTVTSNSSHGPTIQFAHNTENKQWVIGSNGTGTRLDIGYSTNTDRNPHNGIDDYYGSTFLRVDNGGNIQLGRGNGRSTWVNDTLYVGASDSGDSHMFFGEDSSGWYGLHWYWDSEYTVYLYGRNAGTDTEIMRYTTNANNYVEWRRHFHMNNYQIHYLSQVHFNAGTRFVGNNTNYLNFQTDSTSVGGIQVRDGNGTIRGYAGYFGSDGFGLLNSSGYWGIRLNPGNAGTLLYYAGSSRLDTRSGGVGVQGNLYTDNDYGYGLVGLYNSTRYQGVFAMGDAYKLPADGSGPGNLYGIAWTHTNVGGESKAGLDHQALFMINGVTQTAIGSGIWTNGLITTTSYGTSANWNTAFGWGNHATAGYIVQGTQILSGASWTTATRFGSVGDISQGAGNHALSVRSEVGNDAFMSFHIGNDYAVHFGLDDVTNRLHVGGWSDGAVKYQLWDSRDFTSTNISNWNTAYGWGNHASAGYATQTYVNTAISNLVDAAPSTLDTLNELAAALGGDPNFATTVATSIGNKVAKAGDTMTGNLNWGATGLGLTWDMNTDGAYIKFFNTGNGDTDSRLEYGTYDDGNEYHRWVISSVERMNLKAAGLTVTGNVTCTGTFTETSSRRFKENIVDLESATEKVEKLRPVRYNKVNNDATEIGLIAEEVAEFFPEVVTYNENGQPSGVQYQRLSVILLKTIQEQNVALAALTERINKLENK